jgi:hypothetical protein
MEGLLKMDLKVIGCEGVDWINLAQNKNRQGHILRYIGPNMCS